MSVSERIEKSESRRIQLMLDGDADGLEELFHPECVYVHSTGALDDRDSYLRQLREGVFSYRSIDVSELRTVVAGGVATVSFRMDARIVVGGRERQGISRCTAL